MLAVSATANPTQVTLTTSEQYIVCDATSGRVELTLPAASGNSGLQYTIRKTDTSTHNVFVCPAGTETLDGVVATVSQGRNVLVFLTNQWQELGIVSDGTNWQRVDWPTKRLSSAFYYVSATYGNDNYTGLTPWQAKATIGAAISAAGSNATIYIDSGTYTETVVVDTNRIKLIGAARSSYATGTIVKASSTTADCVVVAGSQNTIENIGVQGYETGGLTSWTGNAFRNAAVGYGSSTDNSQNVYRNIYVQNKDNTATDGVNGGVGIFHEGGEECLYENFVIHETNLALYIHAPGAGTCANNVFLRGQLQTNWRDFEKSTATTGDMTNNLFMQIKGYGERCPRATGNIVDLLQDGTDTGGGSCTYINCTFGEASPGSQINVADHNNTFIGCANAPQSNIVVGGSGNRFIELTNQNNIGIALNGDNNTIEGAHITNGNWASKPVTVAGSNNRLRYIRGGTAITDSGTATVIESCDQKSLNWGTGTIASGATSITVSHGLSFTPTRAQSQITVTATNNPTNDPGHIWVDTVGATLFTVNCRSDPGASGLTFSWQARY